MTSLSHHLYYAVFFLSLGPISVFQFRLSPRWLAESCVHTGFQWAGSGKRGPFEFYYTRTVHHDMHHLMGSPRLTLQYMCILFVLPCMP